jgi:phage tail protein X
MRIFRTEEDTTVEELAKRAFGTKAKTALEKLLEANPHLRDRKTLPRGTPVVVPGDHTAGAFPGIDERVANAFDAVKQVLEQARIQIDNTMQAQEKDIDATRQLLHSPDVTKSASEHGLSLELVRAGEDVDAEAKVRVETADHLRKEITRLETQLKKLEKGKFQG